MRVVGTVVVFFAMSACQQAPDGKGPKVSDPAFDQQWSALAKGGGVDPAVIESDVHGAGLMGEIRRAVPPSEQPLAPGALLSGPLPDDQVVRVIRSNLVGMKTCYQVAERAGAVGSGKAILSVEIAPEGSVATVRVEAPAFQSSTLPSCMTNQAKAWTFPKFTQGPKRFSYPFVFVGG